jgi:2-desacetyl-2-hydroxyethyl bacteriochlorophyllide A dehydrogenase
MRAAVFEDKLKILYVEDYPVPSVEMDDALVKVHYCGICGSDITNFKFKLYQAPIIMGHEFSGEVVKLGSNVGGFSIGENVCGINVALDVVSGALDGLGIFQDGGFAEYVKVPKKYLFKIPKSLSLKNAVMVESFANVARGIKLAKLQNRENVMIIGGGNIGLCFLQYIRKLLEPNYVVIVEPQEYLRKKAIEFGANEVFPPSNTRIRPFLKKYGNPTCIFDCAGNQDSIKMSIDLIQKGGTILLEGVVKGKINFPIFLINSKEICLKGCLGHDREDIMTSLNLFAEEKLKADEYISEEIAISEIQNAFEKFIRDDKRNFIKLVVKVID